MSTARPETYRMTSGDMCDVRISRGTDASDLNGVKFVGSHKQGGVLVFEASDGEYIVPISSIVYVRNRKDRR